MNNNAKNGIHSNYPFVLAASASFISALGDQLTLIALPWLMLNLTENASSVGLLIALIAMPRAVCFLIGGALADKLNPRYLLTATRFSSAVLLLALAVLTWRNEISEERLYLFAVGLGLASALGMPAGASILPRLLPKEQLGAGNAVVMGGTQISALLGPAIAGALLLFFLQGGQSRSGFAMVFFLDAISFFLAVAALQFLPLGSRQDETLQSSGSVLGYLREGWNVIYNDRSLLTFLGYAAIINFFITGPVMVGIPLLVKEELNGTAWDYGSFLVAMNVGVLFAMFGSVKLPRPTLPNFAKLVVTLDIVIGLLMVLFVNLSSFFTQQVVLFFVGGSVGYVQVSVMTRIQSRVDQKVLGRIMGYVMFVYFGLVPISSSFAGWLIDQSSAVVMFEIMGASISAAAILFLLIFNKNMKIIVEKK